MRLAALLLALLPTLPAVAQSPAPAPPSSAPAAASSAPAAPSSPPALPASIRLVVPFPPGGGGEFVAHVVAPALARELGTPVEVEFRPGDDGRAGVQSVHDAPADGGTMLLGGPASLYAPALVAGGRMFDPLQDFEPLAIVGTIPRVIAVHPALRVRSVNELVRVARAGDVSIRCGVADALSEFASAEFARITGLVLQCVEYGGVTDKLKRDVASGTVNLTFESALFPDIQRGALRALAVGSQTRLPLLPDVPTASEAGLPGFEVVAWAALFVPKHTPQETVERLGSALARVVARADVREALQRRGYIVRPSTHNQTRQFLRDDFERWRQTIVRRPGKRTVIAPLALTGTPAPVAFQQR